MCARKKISYLLKTTVLRNKKKSLETVEYLFLIKDSQTKCKKKKL